MTGPLGVILSTAWARQGEWGGTTLSRSLIYAGMQRALPGWTGVTTGYESFLHSGETTYIAEGQYPRFAAALLERLERERAPLRAFTQRFQEVLLQARGFLATLADERDPEEKIARYIHLHQDMQPYSYVFGYGEDQVVGELLERLLARAELPIELRQRIRHAAAAPASDLAATRLLQGVREDGADTRAMDFAALVRVQLHVRTERRILWNRIEEAMRPHLAGRAERAGLPLRLLLEATPRELLHALPPRATLEARTGATFLAHRGEVHIIGGAAHHEVQRHLATPRPELGQAIEGRTAYPGIVRGRVRIVLTPEQGDALVRGEILVTDMTTPELTTACGRAGAIVTDRGGILCHAALIARELRIPTVLATEHATRLLHDGDVVEVDADRGVVRVLSAEARP